jgi:hypothetical protein
MRLTLPSTRPPAAVRDVSDILARRAAAAASLER